jgi:hypothetical protein
LSCKDLHLGSPGNGVAYSGVLHFEDYHLFLAVPPGLTGWGAAPVAPFHGFAIFLPDLGKRPSCIVFEINLYMDLGEDHTEKLRSPGRMVKIGGIEGWQEERIGDIDGIQFKNTLISFSVPCHHGDIFDVLVWFAGPAKDRQKNVHLFNDFVRSINFESNQRGTAGKRSQRTGNSR